MSKVRGLWSAILAYCFPDPIKELVKDEAIGDSIRGEQMLSVLRGTPALLTATAINLLLTAYVLFDVAHPTILFGWVATGMLLVTAGLGNTWKFFRGKFTARPSKSTFKAVYNAGLLGMVWGAVPLLFFADASTTQRVFVTCVIAGMMGGSGIALATLPAAAATMSITIGIGALITLLMSGEPVLYLAAIMLVNYEFAIMQVIREQGRRFVQTVVDKYEIEKSSETISLLLKDFQNNSSDWIWETDAEGRFQSVSKRFAEASARSVDELQKLHVSELVLDFPAAERRRDIVASAAAVSRILDKKQPFREITFSVLCDGVVRWWVCSGHPVFHGNGVFAGYRGVASDVSDRKKAELELANLARFDQLTGLANRSEYTAQLRNEIASLSKPGQLLAVFYLDLDRFKSINDKFGHAVGDTVLVEAARRIARELGENDLASRFGGDEFALLLRNIDNSGDAEAVANRIVASLEKPLDVNGHHVSVGASIGIAVSGDVGDVAEELIHNADMALYRAKADGRGTFKLFAEDMGQNMQKRREMEMELREAVSGNQLELHYQPLANIGTGDIIGFEALLRWNNPKRGMVAPDDFIPLAEDSGLIHDIGDWVIGQACRDAKAWTGQQRVAVNLSGKQLQSHRLVNRVVKVLAETGLPPQRLELEVTETVLINDPEMALKILTNLRDLGVNISLDDFGIGYSSMAYLVKFPFDKLKIDKSFVQSAQDRPENLAIIRSILGLARELNIATLAEGVETQEQLDLLRNEGCDEVQGFFLDKPKALAAITEFHNYSIGDAAGASAPARSVPIAHPALTPVDNQQTA